MFFVLFSIAKVKNVSDTKILALFMIVLWGLATFRSYDIGNDTKNYSIIFQNIASTGNYKMWEGRFEVGYLFLNKILGHITNNFTIFLAVVNAVIFYAYYKFIKEYSNNKIFSVVIFFTLGFWGQTVNVIRLQLAIAMYIYAYLAKERKNVILSIGFPILAFLFQRISIVYCVAFFMPKKINRKIYFTFAVLSAAIFIGLQRVLSVVSNFIPYFSLYANNDSSYQIGDVKLASIIGLIIRCGVLVFGLIVYKTKIKYEENSNYNNKIIEQINMIFISVLIMFVSLKFNLLDRCASFFWVYSLALIPNCINKYDKYINRKIMEIFFIAMCVIYFIVVNIFRPEWNHIYPYTTIFNNV